MYSIFINIKVMEVCAIFTAQGKFLRKERYEIYAKIDDRFYVKYL